jgi:hypothetical protein
VYGATLGRAGVTIRCEPVYEIGTVNTWASTWHGVQDLAEQWIKVQYYRFYVLPFKARVDSAERSPLPHAALTCTSGPDSCPSPSAKMEQL